MKKVLLVFALFGSFFLASCEKTPAITAIPGIEINGDSEVTITLNQEFIDLGAQIIGDYNVQITVDSDLDETTPGTYHITYSFEYEGETYTATRTVHVVFVDEILPVITLTGDATVYVEYMDTYTDEGAVFSDNLDTSGTVVVGGDAVDTTTLGTYVITYNATDLAGNEATEVSRTVIVQDTTAPVLTIVGYETLTYGYMSTYTDGGATFSDNYDTTGTVTIGGDAVDTSVLGTYLVTYNATDSNGNEAATLTRTVVVTDLTSPVLTLTGDATIYLEVGTTYTEEGATSTDNYDPDGVATVGGDTVDVNALGTYIVAYNALDAHDNAATTINRTVIVQDTTGPTIDLIGGYVVYVNLDGTYVEPGADFSDNYDTTGTVTIAGDTVDTSVLGDYVVTYNAVDASGNHATEVTRTVTVVQSEPTIENAIYNAQTTTVGFSFDLVDPYGEFTQGYVRILRGSSQFDIKTDLVVGHNTYTFENATYLYENDTYTIEIWWGESTTHFSTEKIYTVTFDTPPEITLDSFAGEEVFFSLDNLILQIDLDNAEDFDIDFVTINYTQYEVFKYPSDNNTIYVDMGSRPSGDYPFVLNNVGITLNGMDYLYTFDEEIVVHVYMENEIDPDYASVELLDITTNILGGSSFVLMGDTETTTEKYFYFHFDNPYEMVINSITVGSVTYSNFTEDNEVPNFPNTVKILLDVTEGENQVFVSGYSYYRNDDLVTVTVSDPSHNNAVKVFGYKLIDETVILTPGDFQNMYLNPSGNYILGADLDFTDYPFIPIGTQSSPFTGTFNGQGHTISNLTISEEYGLESNTFIYSGIFRYVQNGFISDLVIDGIDMNITSLNNSSEIFAGILSGRVDNSSIININITGSSMIDLVGGKHGQIGGMIGFAFGNVTVKNNNTNIQINLAPYDSGAGNFIIGGLIGNAQGPDIIHSSATGSIIISKVYSASIGGLVGTIYNFGGSSDYNYIYNSMADVDIVSNATYSTSYAGGLVGKLEYAINPTIIYNSFALGDVTASYRYVAGLVGSGEYGKMYNTFSTGNLTMTGMGAYGLLVGKSSTVTNANVDNNFTYDGRVVTVRGTVLTPSAGYPFDPTHLRDASQAQFDDAEFYTHVVGLNEYYFDFTTLNITNGDMPTIK